MRSAVDELWRGLRCVFLVCNLATEEVAGLRWMREGIGRIDLPSESLIQRSHNISPVQKKQVTACQDYKKDLVLFVFLGEGGASRYRYQEASFHVRDGAQDKEKTPGW